MVALITSLICTPELWAWFYNFLYQCSGPH